MSHLHHKISALVDGELHGPARRRALDHARRCADCRHELKATLVLKSRMSGLSPAEPSADLVRVLSKVSRDTQSHRAALALSLAAGARSRLRPVARRVLVGAGTMSLAVMSLAYAVGGAGGTTVAGVAPPIDEYTADFAGNTGLAPLADPAVEGLAGDLQPAALTVSSASASRVASTPTARPSRPGDEPRAVATLRHAMQAPNRFAYEGTRQVQTFDTGTATALAIDVEHSPGQGTSFEVAGGGSDATATFIAERGAQASGSLDGAPLSLLVDAYDIAIVGSGSVLGRPVTIIAASRQGVVDARFWVDDATGLLVRREMYDGGSLVRSTGFTDLQVSRSGFLPHLPPELEAPPATKLSMTSAAPLNDDGWSCPARLPGAFTLTGLEHLETPGDVMRASYSDGLSTLSVFEQRGSLDLAAVAGLAETSVGGGDVYVRYGLPTVAVWDSAGTVYTVVTDAPHDVAAGVIAGLPHTAHESVTAVDRVATGLRRMASLLNPSD